MKTMTGNDPFAALVEPATLRIERRLPGPLERVWEWPDAERTARQMARGR